jgi:amino acid transporter
MFMAKNGVNQSIAISRGSTGNAFDMFFLPAKDMLGTFGADLYRILTVFGSFACALAFHNAASRYLYAMGREGLSPKLSATIGRTHGKHGSPHISSVVQTVVTLAITLAFFWGQSPTKTAPDVAYYYLYGLMAIAGTMAILIIQSLCSLSVVAYFHVRGNHPETAHWWRTLLAPLLGTAGMAYVVYLLWQNKDFAAGAAAGSPVFKATPYLVLGIFLVGIVAGLVIRQTRPDRYDRIGQTTFEEDYDAAAEAPVVLP